MEAEGEEGGEEEVDEEEQDLPQRLGCLCVIKATVQISKCFTVMPENACGGRGGERKMSEKMNKCDPKGCERGHVGITTLGNLYTPRER